MTMLDHSASDVQIRERAVELVQARGHGLRDQEVPFYKAVKNMEEYLRTGVIPTHNIP